MIECDSPYIHAFTGHVNATGTMPSHWSPPVLCLEVLLTYDILSADRARSQMMIFHDKISFLLRSDDQSPTTFDLSNFTIQVLPNLDTLLVIGTGTQNKHDIYAFLTSERARDNCMATMSLLGFRLLNEFRQTVLQRRMIASNSLPSMSTILEDS